MRSASCDVRDAARCDLPAPSRRGPSGFGIQTHSIFFLRLEESHDHNRSDHYQKSAGDRLTENAGNGQSGDSYPLNPGPAATRRFTTRSFNLKWGYCLVSERNRDHCLDSRIRRGYGRKRLLEISSSQFFGFFRL